jgi:hypothetical protein
MRCYVQLLIQNILSSVYYQKTHGLLQNIILAVVVYVCKLLSWRTQTDGVWQQSSEGDIMT